MRDKIYFNTYGGCFKNVIIRTDISEYIDSMIGDILFTEISNLSSYNPQSCREYNGSSFRVIKI